MRKSFPLVAALSAILSLPALAQSGPDQPASAQPGTGRQEQSTQMSGTAGHRGSEVLSAPKFVELAASHAIFQTEAAKLALERSRDDAQRNFAQAVLAAHAQDMEKLRKNAPQGAKVPQEMSEQHRTWITQLRDAQGGNFQALYTQQQSQAPLIAVDLFRNYAQVGDNEELKRWAAAHLPVLQAHLSKARALKG
ncbi:hypothetical protein CR162_18790 [Pseudoroseomonas rhizosphaerae]|uniref:DUF4142 domain-containing protein n=2 Tax=Roseomonadaceae TaxID=3385906 RepID=A0A2C7A8L8_9PROT|nr:hypothetical protein CR162_18790 [Pseudoroseomonas rhizosphaerae]